MKKNVNLNGINGKPQQKKPILANNTKISFKPDLLEIKEVESYKKYNTDISEQKNGCCGTSKCNIQ